MLVLFPPPPNSGTLAGTEHLFQGFLCFVSPTAHTLAPLHNVGAIRFLTNPFHCVLLFSAGNNTCCFALFHSWTMILHRPLCVCIHAAFLCVPALLRFFVFMLLLSVRSWSGRFSPPEAPTALPHCQGVLSRLSLSLSGVQQSRAQQRIPSQCVGLCGQESL